MDLVDDLLPPHEELHLGLALVPGAEPEVGRVELDPDEGGDVVAGVEHPGRLGQQVLQDAAVLTRPVHRGEEVVVELRDGLGRLGEATVATGPDSLAVQGVGGEDEALPALETGQAAGEGENLQGVLTADTLALEIPTSQQSLLPHLGRLHAGHVGLGDLGPAGDGHHGSHVHREVLVHDSLGVGQAAVRHDGGLQVDTVAVSQQTDGVDVDDATDVLHLLLREVPGQLALLSDHPDQVLVVERPGLSLLMFLVVTHHPLDDGPAHGVLPALQQDPQSRYWPVECVLLPHGLHVDVVPALGESGTLDGVTGPCGAGLVTYRPATLVTDIVRLLETLQTRLVGQVVVGALSEAALCEYELALVNISSGHQQSAHPRLVLGNDGPGLLMVRGVVELPVLLAAVLHLAVEVTALLAWQVTQPAALQLREREYYMYYILYMYI